MVRRLRSLAIAALLLASALTVGMLEALPPTVAHEPPALVTDQARVPIGARTEAIAPGRPVSVTLTLVGRDPSGLAQFLAATGDPSSPEYHDYLTAAEFEDRFGPSPTTADAVAAALAADGARNIVIAPDRLTVSGVLPAAAVESTFGVSLVEIGTTGPLTLYTSIGSPRLPNSLQGEVSGIDGLSDVAVGGVSLNLACATALRLEPRDAGPEFLSGNTSGAQWFLGSDYAQALQSSAFFPGSGAPNATFPEHVAIATLLGSGFNASTGSNLPPWQPEAIGWYLDHTLGPGWPVSNVTGVPVTYDGITPPLPGNNSGLNDTSLDQVENSLDIEMAASVAPGAPVYNYYVAGSILQGGNTLTDLADAFATELTAALTHGYGTARLGVVSASFGVVDTNDSAWNSALGMAAAMGVTIVAASGDQGNAPDYLTSRPLGQWPSWPATAAFNDSGAIAVGGVTLNVSGEPAGWYNSTGIVLEFDPHISGVNSVVTWYDTIEGPGALAGSEGGLSTVYDEPYWQFHSAAQPPIAAAAGLQGASFLGRAEPDVALPANYTIIVASVNGSSGLAEVLLVSGTSVAAPVFAGVIAELTAVRSRDSTGASWSPLGYLDPTLYRIASYYAAFPSSPGDPYVDVTEGQNYVFSAAAGWDPTTGWGMPLAKPLLAALGNPEAANYNYTGPTPGLPSSGSSSSPFDDLYLLVGIGLTLAVVVVLLAARPRRRAPSPVPPGAQAGFGPPPMERPPPASGATFLCPYCGTPRPAEPVRCPACGAY